jgi:poly-gamma-glutamate capsule biosynthesis protein CapA/YwtB (metallophosphatase superfamily)
MATEEQATEQGARLGPQTPAARRLTPPPPEEPPELGQEPAGPAGPATPVARELTEIEEFGGEPEVTSAADAAAVVAAEPAVAEEPAVARQPPGPPPGASFAALVILGSALAILLAFGTWGGLPLPTVAGFEARPSLDEVAPGGRIMLSGSGAPAGSPLVLETRVKGGEWETAGRASTDAEGAFRVIGRVAAAPGPVLVRARAAEGVTSRPATVRVRPLRLSSVGDINLGDVAGVGISNEGPRYPWKSVGRRLRNADIAFGNLECAVSRRGEPFDKLYNFRATPRALRGLARHSGIDVLNLANNHVGDYGPVALLDTVRGVERLGIEAVGAGRNLRRALTPQVVERLGLRVAFVGFSEILPVEFAAAKGRPGTAWATPEAITAAVHRARRRADIVVATFHWGIEKAPAETGQQQALAAAAAAAGAQLVIGAHPHVLQPLRRQGSALVAYSLGNFVFGAVSDDTTATGILETDLTSEGVAAARWRPGHIAGGRPLLERSRARRLPVGDPARMAAGVQL